MKESVFVIDKVSIKEKSVKQVTFNRFFSHKKQLINEKQL